MRRSGRPILWLAFAASILTIFVVVAMPTLYIQPFKPQTGRGMAIAFAAREIAPLLTMVGFAMAVGMGVWLAAVSRRLAVRVSVVLLLAAAAGPVWFARQNHFEWMFAPLPAAEYATAADAAGFLADTEIVIGVQVGTAAHAYPIRQLGYHHVVNTEVGGKPIVATY